MNLIELLKKPHSSFKRREPTIQSIVRKDRDFRDRIHRVEKEIKWADHKADIQEDEYYEEIYRKRAKGKRKKLKRIADQYEEFLDMVPEFRKN